MNNEYNIAYQFNKERTEIAFFSSTNLNEMPWMYNCISTEMEIPLHFVKEFTVRIPVLKLCTENDISTKGVITIKNKSYKTDDCVQFINVIILKELVSSITELEMLKIFRTVSHTPVYQVKSKG